MNRKISLMKSEIKTKVDTFLKEIGNDIDLLYELSTRDEKTGLYNFRFFKSVLQLESERYVRNLRNKKQKSFTIMIIDLDNFKKINTDYGHMTGDKILLELADYLKESLRKSDTVARFGGEEFIMLMPETGINKAKKLSDRLRRGTINNHTLKKFNITFSGGIAEFNGKENCNSLIKRADKALYKAKNKGKNRTEIARWTEKL